MPGRHAHRGTAGLVILLGGLLLAAVARAEQGELPDLESLTLQELLQIRVVTPTARGERAAAAPAVISVLTGEQIRALGVSTLYQALSYLPGVQVSESYFGYTMVNVRGALQNHYNNRVLLMVNGHPSREVVNGSFHLEIVPMEAVDRIELVRGPGSALYGTNAFAAVVNIITLGGAEPACRSAGVGIGSFSTTEAFFNLGGRTGDAEYLLAASVRDDAGYPFRVDEDEQGASGVLDYENDIANVFASLQVGGLRVFAAYFEQDKSKLGIVPVIALDGPTRYQGGLVDLEWQHQWPGRGSVGARLRYDRIRRRSDIGSFPYDGFQGHADGRTVMRSSGQLFGAELNLSYVHSENVSFLGGVVFESRETDPYTWHFTDDDSMHPFTAFDHSASARDVSVYGEGLFDLSPRTHLVLGLRLNEDNQAGFSYVPRAGLVYRVGEATFLKVLLAGAYRTPDFFEKEVETYNVLFGDPRLQPEWTRNVDVAVDSTLGESVSLRVNGFLYVTGDLITRQPTTEPELTGPLALQYVNGGGERIWGVETSLMAEPSSDLRLFANHSFRKGEDRDTGRPLEFIAEHTFNAGLSWTPGRRLRLSPNVQYVAARGQVDAYLLLNLVLDWSLGSGLELSVIASNLTDERYAYPEYIRRNIAAVPGGPERSGLVRLRWQPGGGRP